MQNEQKDTQDESFDLPVSSLCAANWISCFFSLLATTAIYWCTCKPFRNEFSLRSLLTDRKWTWVI